jgi:hypothetical protein
MTYLDPDLVTLFANKIATDSVIEGIEGLSVQKIVDGVELGTTKNSPGGNQVVIVSKPRCGPFQPNCGNKNGQVRKFVKIECICYAAVGADDNALTLTETIDRRIRQMLFSATFLGTGWMQHNEVEDRYPSAPMGVMAYHVQTYDVLCSVGNT